jgi:dethiobiotin synthetase
MANYFVTAIGTGCGKTLVSAILCEALKADYWKPIQSGTTEIDSETVRSLVSNQKTFFFPERFLLTTPVSPHLAAKLDVKKVDLSDFDLPKTENKNLVIEGAGGVLVPLNEKSDLVIDLASKFEAEIIIVSHNYLGSINHTLLTIEAIKSRKLNIKGIIFNGETNVSNENIILTLSHLPCLLKLKHEPIISPKVVSAYAKILKRSFS